MAFVKINDKEYEVENGQTILEFAKANGIDIPYYCYHPKLSIVASCRMCLVEVEGFPKLVTACSTQINEAPPHRKVDGKYDMVIHTENEKVKEARASVLEFLLLNHPIDCPECDQAGYCKLQDYSFAHGEDHSRFEFDKRVPPKKDLGPTMLLYTTRCILCSRCVRFTREISGTHELIVKMRGAKAEIDIVPEIPLDNNLSMNVADICPVGALVTKDFLFKPRVWNYKHKRTICTGCSKGCNIEVDFIDYENKIYKIKPVLNTAVNEMWMCDEGRLLYHQYESNRLEFPMVQVNGQLVKSNWLKAMATAKSKLDETDKGKLLVVVSAFMTNEELYLMKKLIDEKLSGAQVVLADNYLQKEDEVFPGFTVEGTKAPNLKGVEKIFGKIDTLSAVKKGLSTNYDGVYWISGDPFAHYDENLLSELGKVRYVVVQDSFESDLSKLAEIVLPMSSPYETDGTYINSNNILQKARQIIMPPKMARTGFEILIDWYENYQIPRPIRAAKTFEVMAAAIKDFKVDKFSEIPEEGIKL